MKLCDVRKPGREFFHLEGVFNKAGFTNRIDLAEAAELISEGCAKNCKAVNNVRTELAHWKPMSKAKNTADAWGLAHVEEITSEDAFEPVMQLGHEAFKELLDNLDRLLKETKK